MMMGTLPSDIRLDAIPLVGTLGRSAIEVAAAYIVRTCHVNGDRWQPVTPEMISYVLRGDIWENVEPLASLSQNPFARPDFHALVREGYADGAMVDGRLVEGTPVTLTARAIEAIEKHRRVPPPHEAQA